MSEELGEFKSWQPDSGRRPNRSRKETQRYKALLKVVAGGIAGLALGYLFLLLIQPKFLQLAGRGSQPAASQGRTATSAADSRSRLRQRDIVKRVRAEGSHRAELPPHEEPSSEDSITRDNETATSARETDDASDNLLPIPSEEAQQSALEVVAEVYKPLYESASTRADKTALARKLLNDAIETQDDPVSRFVILGSARDLATKALDWQTAFEIVDQIGKAYAVDNTIAMKVTVLKSIEANSDMPEAMQGLLDGANVALDEAVIASRYDLAEQLASLGVSAIRKLQETDDGTTEASVDEYAAAVKAFCSLKENPADPTANVIAGKFLCFVRTNWDQGLRLLSLGDNESLKQLASREISHPRAAGEMLALADAWRNESKAAEIAERDAMRRRAAYWYKQSLPHLAGFSKSKAETGLQEIRRDEKDEAERRLEEARRADEEAQTRSSVDRALQIVKSLRIKSPAAVEREAQECGTAKEALLIYEAFLAAGDISAEAKIGATLRLPFWEVLAAKDFVRLGTHWVSREDVKKAREEAKVLLQDAVKLLAAKQYELAKKKLEKASRVDPNSTHADHVMGLIFAVMARDFKSGEKHFRECIRRDPLDAAARNNLMIVEVFLKDYPAALGAARQSVALAIQDQVIAHSLSRIVAQIESKRIAAPDSTALSFGELASRANNALESELQEAGWLYAVPDLKQDDGSDILSSRKLGEILGLAVNGQCIVDHGCVACRATGNIACPAAGCIGGKVSVARSTDVGDEVLHGTPISQSRRFREPCSTCGGTGVVSCPYCSGRGTTGD